jgi:protein-S-isoprenylcysteine O-methyltransferase Ste14
VNKNNKTSPIKLFLTFIYILFFPVLLLFLSNNWAWIEGWLFSIWFLLLCYSTIVYLYFKNPELLEERYKKPGTGNQKGWDTFVVVWLAIGFIAWVGIMPLDAERFHWSLEFPVWIKISGGLLLCLSFFFFFRSYTDNTFLSPLIRVQTDRKHKVVSTGVYGFVRHPMYLAALLLFLGSPLLLGSMYGLVIGIVMVLLLAGRILGEEKMLIEELDGYSEYKKRVKYRLIPFVW